MNTSEIEKRIKLLILKKKSELEDLRMKLAFAHGELSILQQAQKQKTYFKVSPHDDLSIILGESK